jgi:hypothetical protein
MSTITIDEQTRAMLEKNARSRGLALPDYLKLLAETDGNGDDPADSARQAELHRRIDARVQAARKSVPRPITPAGASAAFADAMFAKHRSKQ